MKTPSAVPQTPTADVPPAARLAYVPPKLERLDTGETLFNFILPIGDDGILYS